MADKIAKIEVRVRELAQLFNSMDPSPFLDRDLDADAEEFIVTWAREHPTDHELELVIHLQGMPPDERAAGIETAVRHYFAMRAQMKRREFNVLMRHGRQSLLIGLSFLAGCLTLGHFVPQWLPEATAEIVRESLTILGWVAMWRPLQLYLYDWWPVREDQLLLGRLSRMRVHLVLPKPPPPVPI